MFWYWCRQAQHDRVFVGKLFLFSFLSFLVLVLVGIGIGIGICARSIARRVSNPGRKITRLLRPERLWCGCSYRRLFLAASAIMVSGVLRRGARDPHAREWSGSCSRYLGCTLLTAIFLLFSLFQLPVCAFPVHMRAKRTHSLGSHGRYVQSYSYRTKRSEGPWVRGRF